MGALMRAHDWTRSPLGSPQTWPDALRMAVSICLNSRFPMVLWWGPELVMLYNDAWRPVLGKTKHPSGLGRPGRESWPEIWDIIGAQLGSVLATGEATWSNDLLLAVDRNNYREEAYFTYSYSPIKHRDGSIGGVFSAVSETTERVLGERRLRTLRELAAQTAESKSVEEACRSCTQVLGNANPDVPFALLYLIDEQANCVSLAAATALNESVAPRTLALTEGDPWHISDVIRDGKLVVLNDLASRFGDLPGGVWPEPTTSAAVLPVAKAGQGAGTAGALIVGINPRRAFDDTYGGFLDLVAGHIATAVTNARTYEEERKRAEALAELDRAKTAFFSNVSHEFRTPLTLMLGPLEEALAESATDGNKQYSLIELAHRNGLRLLRLVNTLLDFARIEAGRVDAVFEPTDLSAFTAELASSFRSAMDKAGLHFEVECEPLEEPVFVDREMWEKVVLNLLSNAFKFTFEGQIFVQLKSRSKTEVELLVQDTGVGIPGDELPLVFERFHRVQGQRGRSFEGSGIGLALVQELVKLHGGRIEVESEPGKGTTFRIILRFGSAHLPGERIGAERALASTSTRSDAYVEEAIRWLPETAQPELKSEVQTDVILSPTVSRPQDREGRVLLADDNADLRAYVGRLLREQGYEVDLAEDGKAALEAARTRAPDLILSDVMMPRLDGVELLNSLRSDPELSDIPIVLLSARAGEEAKVEGLSAGADDYLTKPFSAAELLARVSTNLAVARVRRTERQRLREESRILETLNRVGAAVAAELDLERAVQAVTDAATQLSGAAFGAFFYNVLDESGESYMLYTLSGVPREAFSNFPMPRNTAVFAPTFRGEAIVRSGDITQDPRYGKNAPNSGPPKGHLPVRSYLACPVVSRSGEVLGGLFFGHPEPQVFNERSERLVAGIASQAAIAIDNARLYRSLRDKEAALTKLNAELEKRVEERTAELAAANRGLLNQIEERERVETTLRQMQRLEAVGQLTSGVAHDFNNLLTVVLGNIGFLERGIQSGDPKFAQRLSYMRAAAERGAKLTSQLLAFSRRQRLEPKPINLSSAIESLGDLLRSTLGSTIQIKLKLQPELWPALADPTQIELVVLNLAINARDAMDVGGTVLVETGNVTRGLPQRQEEPPAGEYVMMAVCDTGTGMSEEVLAKCFEPFFTTKEVGKGSGLGLSQVLGFAKQSGGGISIESEVGRGTTVRLYLPRASSYDATVPSEGTVTHDQLPSKLQKPTRASILLVDDDSDVRETTASMLREYGYTVHEAGSGGAALEMLENNGPVDLMLIDFVMPGMNGSELAREVKSRKPGLPVLFVTGYADTAALAEVGEDRVIRKPFLDNQLETKVRALTSRLAQKGAVLQ